MAVYHCFVKLSDAHYSKQLVRGRSISRHAPPCDRDDDGGDDGQALHHELYSWRKNCHVEKFQLSLYDNCGEIENFSACGEISDVFYCNLCRFVAKTIIHAVLSQNFATVYMLSCGEKLRPKVHFWRKNDKY